MKEIKLFKAKIFKTIFIVLIFHLLVSCDYASETVKQNLVWKANVSANSATFVFPKIEKEDWTWNNLETKELDIEYNWSVGVGRDPNKPAYLFGPAKYKFSDNKPRKGTLSELIKYCQHNISKSSKHGTVNLVSYGEAKVINNQVHLFVTDKKLIAEIFATKPLDVYMRLKIPGLDITKDVLIVYE